MIVSCQTSSLPVAMYALFLANVVDDDDVMEVDVSSMAVKDLLDVEHHFCHDSGSAAGISTKRDDFVWFDESEAAKRVGHIRGPSVGAPGCEGRGPLVYRVEQDGVPYGLIDPEGVGAAAEMNFRVTSCAAVQETRGVRVVSGKFNEPDCFGMREDRRSESK